MKMTTFGKCFSLIVVFLLPPLTSFSFQVCKTNDGLHDIKWSSSNVNIYVNATGGPANSFYSICTAAQTWTSVSTAMFTFGCGSTSALPNPFNKDGTNIIGFASFSQSGLGTNPATTFSFYNSSNGNLEESDIIFNTDYPWATDGSPSSNDVQNAATHELGHSLCLADLYGSADSEKTMYGYTQPGETKKRTLDQDDINGISYLYPVNNQACILYINTTPVSGDIYVDDVLKGKGSWSGGVSQGSHKISFGPVSGYTTPPSQYASVYPGYPAYVMGTYVLQETGTLSVSTTPVNGAIYVDDEYKGTGSWSGSVPASSHKISFGDISGYVTPATQYVNVNPSQSTTVIGTYTLAGHSIFGYVLSTKGEPIQGVQQICFRYKDGSEIGLAFRLTKMGSTVN